MEVKKMGRTHKTRWTNEFLEQQIKRVMSELQIDRMPTRSEIFSIRFNDPLHNGIVRHGGYDYWAKKLKLSVKDSESKTGWEYEEIAAVLLKEKGYSVIGMKRKCAFDLLINDSVKVDVKVGKPWLLRGSRVHTFGINKKVPVCDIYMIFALHESGKTERLFIIPSTELKLSTMCIGKESKYNKFIDRWDFIDKYDSFYKSIVV
jgi:hypothetical protein